MAHLPPLRPCLMFDGGAEEAARFYAATFPDSAVGAIHRAPSDYPSGRKGDVLTVEFTLLGQPCIGVNGGPYFQHTEAFSFQVTTENQTETDAYWNAIVKTAAAKACAAGARTDGAFPGRSPRAHCPKPWLRAATKPGRSLTP